MISSKEIRRTGNDMKATVRFNVFLNVQNLILKKANTTFFETLEWFCYSSLGILYFPFIRLWFSMFNIFACMISLFQSVLVRILCRKMYVSICYQLKLLNKTNKWKHKISNQNKIIFLYPGTISKLLNILRCSSFYYFSDKNFNRLTKNKGNLKLHFAN